MLRFAPVINADFIFVVLKSDRTKMIRSKMKSFAIWQKRLLDILPDAAER
jgi:hypothetical protein